MRIRNILAAASVALVLPLSACGAAGCEDDDFAGDTSVAVLADDCEDDD